MWLVDWVKMMRYSYATIACQVRDLNIILILYYAMHTNLNTLGLVLILTLPYYELRTSVKYFEPDGVKVRI